MRETALVSILMLSGISHRRAVCLERMLDDRAPYGFTSDLLADLFEVYANAKIRQILSDPESDRLIQKLRGGLQLSMNFADSPT